MKLATQTVVSSLVTFVVFVALVFLPAGTFDYWQGWLFIAILVVASAGPAIHLGVKNPAALERRMRGGPLAESRTPQKIASSGTLMSLPAAIVISAIDHRFGWSSVPEEFSLIGDVLVVIGVGISFLVIIQNTYAAANITVEADQKVVSTGLYRLVRHPMYVGMLIFFMSGLLSFHQSFAVGDLSHILRKLSMPFLPLSIHLAIMLSNSSPP